MALMGGNYLCFIPVQQFPNGSVVWDHHMKPPLHVCFCDFCPLLGNRNTAECFGYRRISNLPDLDMKFTAPASDRRHFRTSLCHSCANEDELRTTIRYDRCRSLKYVQKVGGAEEDRTPDLRIANATLSQLSYRPGPREVDYNGIGFNTKLVYPSGLYFATLVGRHGYLDLDRLAYLNVTIM